MVHGQQVCDVRLRKARPHHRQHVSVDMRPRAREQAVRAPVADVAVAVHAVPTLSTPEQGRTQVLTVRALLRGLATRVRELRLRKEKRVLRDDRLPRDGDVREHLTHVLHDAPVALVEENRPDRRGVPTAPTARRHPRFLQAPRDTLQGLPGQEVVEDAAHNLGLLGDEFALGRVAHEPRSQRRASHPRPLCVRGLLTGGLTLNLATGNAGLNPRVHAPAVGG